MKKTIFALSLLTSIIAVSSCKNEPKDQEVSTEQTSSEEKPAADEATQPSNDPKTYVVSATPDTASLGKNKEAFVRVKDIKVIELSDPDGKSKGMQLTYKVELTNRNTIGGKTIGVNTGDFRLELDNGQKVAPSSRYVSSEPEETKTSEEDTFEVPVGVKPVGLSLFMDDTRASIKLELK